jgi:hypothetical protein
VLVLLDNGVPVRADLTIAVDIATRTICAAVLRPVDTKAVDAALLLARMLVPEPMRPGWSTALRMSTSRLPHAQPLASHTTPTKNSSEQATINRYKPVRSLDGFRVADRRRIGRILQEGHQIEAQEQATRAASSARLRGEILSTRPIATR